MGDETPQNVMNLDLNLGPVEREPRGLNLEDWLDGPVRDSTGHRALARQRWRSIWRPVLLPLERLETGEGSMAAADVSLPEVTKTCDDVNGNLKDEILEDKEDVVKSIGDEGGFFDCNICLDMASDPVVTCCGHLFCWPCLYRWLHINADVKECPICKGEMTTKTVTPIYGRGNPTRMVDQDSGLKIPHRPKAKRVESWRQTIQRNIISMPMDEMIRVLGNRFDLTRDLVQDVSSLPDNSREILERNNSLFERYLNSRRVRTDSSLTLVGPVQNDQEQTPLVEDRDSVSSIAAVIQSESQTVDTAVEIDSRVSLSSSSSRRRSESLTVFDVDNGDSRALRRRRLH
ncbi:uncharacterized protein [Rutidosis leptorrhynchoides]|uniref:uncharacterized protein n=1 Tax=Rutidosis leptorrhynchoides TaxID=125765 RepID=UPI003A99E39E